MDIRGGAEEMETEEGSAEDPTTDKIHKLHMKGGKGEVEGGARDQHCVPPEGDQQRARLMRSQQDEGRGHPNKQREPPACSQ